MRLVWQIAVISMPLFLIGCGMIGPLVGDVEQPVYKVLSQTDAIEIRRYEPKIIAEVEVTGAREDAIGDGFRLLADYIFGNNTATKDIAMTAPVQQQASQEIAMTAPVQQQALDDSLGNRWRVSFVMPSAYTMETLPTPRNSAVTLKEVPAKRMAVIEFSGRNSNDNIAEHEAALRRYIDTNDLQPIGPPVYAFYDPPWTLPFLRRNEVMLEIEG